MLPRITLRQLRYFAVLSKTQHFGRAAEACAVSQPALSVQIQELEANLGVKLLSRERGGFVLTEAGQEVARRAEALLAAAADLESAVSQAAEGGLIKLGVIPTIGPYLLPGLLETAKTELPQMEFRIQEAQTARLLEALRSGSLDVAVLALPVEGEGLRSLELVRDKFLLAAPASLKVKPPASLDAVGEMPLLLLQEGHCLRDQALKVCEIVGEEAFSSFSASSLTTLIELVGAGQGVTLVPELCLSALAHDKRITVARFEEPQPSRTIGLVWRASSGREAVFRKLGELVKRIVDKS